MPVINNCLVNLVQYPSCLYGGPGDIDHPVITGKLISDLTSKEKPNMDMLFNDARQFAAEQIMAEFGSFLADKAKICNHETERVTAQSWGPSSVISGGYDQWEIGNRVVVISDFIVNVQIPGIFNFYANGYQWEKTLMIQGVFPLNMPNLFFIGPEELTIGWSSSSGTLVSTNGFTSATPNIKNISASSGLRYKMTAECSWMPLICAYPYKFERAMKLLTIYYLLSTAINSPRHTEAAFVKNETKKASAENIKNDYINEMRRVADSVPLSCCDECYTITKKISYKTTF